MGAYPRISVRAPEKGGIRVFLRRSTILIVMVLVAVGGVLGVTQAALGYTGGVHRYSTQRAVDVMQVYDRMDAIAGKDAFAPYRADAGVRFFPQLTNPWDAVSYDLVNCAWEYDDFVGDWGTRNHFWTADDDLDECPEGIVGVDNAWETARIAWYKAIIYYQSGQLPLAYFYLGAVMHLTEDMAQPAHTNSDLHGPANLDSLEEWGGEWLADHLYSWTIPGQTSPGRAFIPPSKQKIIQRVISSTAWEGRDEFLAEPALVNPSDPFNTAQLLYIMYVTNQWANYFASDGESGNKRVRLGWVDYEALGFPKHLHRYGVNVSPQSESALDDNEGGCDHAIASDDYCDFDQDLQTISRWGYKAATKGAGGVLELFRRTVDSTPPVTTVVTTRDDGRSFVEGAWSASPVTLRLTGATDPQPLPIFPPAGVWTMYLSVDGQPAVTGYSYPISSMQKTFAASGSSTARVLTTDNAGNTEAHRIFVKVDVTDPAVTFPGWRAWYHECETLKATWMATDAHSGVDHSLGFLGARALVRNATIPRSLRSVGAHTLTVSARDNVGNNGSAQHQFTIFDHGGLAIGKPSVTRVGTGALYYVSGTLTPTHYAGTSPITLAISKRVTTAGAVARLVPATITKSGKYSALVTLTAGNWKVRAQHKYPTMTSAYSYFTVH